MKPVPKMAIVLVAILSCTIAACAVPGVKSVDVSYAAAYDNAKDAAAAADVVVVAVVDGIDSAEEDRLTPGFGTTLLDMSATNVIKGPIDKDFTLKQDGGPVRDGRMVVDGDPPLVEGSTYLLFLVAIKGGPYDGDYFMLGGPSGRLRVMPDGSLRAEGASLMKVDKTETLDSIDLP